MATTSQMAHDLSAHNALPVDFGPFCDSLLKHTRELYPQTSLDCDTTPTKPPTGLQRIGGNVMEANLVKKVQPTYPQAAKNRRIQGTVEFTGHDQPPGRDREPGTSQSPARPIRRIL